MKLVSINEWLTLVANLGVLAGIVFLAIEIQQNNDHLAAQARATQFESRSRNANGVFLDNSNITEVIIKSANGEDLTQTERFLRDRWYNQIFLNFEYDFQEYLSGYRTITDADLDRWSRTIWLREGMAEQWQRTKNDRFTDSFIEFMDSNVDGL